MIAALALILKSSIVLAVALVAAAAARRSSSALRHWILSASVMGALAMPIATLVVPAWTLPEEVVPRIERVTVGVTSTIPPAEPRIARSGLAEAPGVPWVTVLLAGWGAGTAVSFGLVGLGLLRLRRLGASAAPAAAEWQALASELAKAVGVSRPVTILMGRHPLAPMTWGQRAPRVLLPEAAAHWPPSRRRMVIAHELAHVARGDWASHVLGEMLRGMYWFNPLAWLVCRRRQQESEHACDDRVLALGVDGIDYAAQLVDLARDAHRKPWLPAPAIVRPSGLERRIRAMLNPGLNRMGVTARGRAALAAATLAIIVALAGVSAAQALASFGGSVVDPQNAVLPGVRLVLTNTDTEAKIVVRSDRNGRFEFPPLTPGTYNVEVELPGFSSLRSTVRLQAGQRMEPSLQLAVGELEETVTSVDPGAGTTEMPRIQSRKPRPIPPCNAAATTTLERSDVPGVVAFTTRPIGGNIRPPVRIRNVAPIYPLGYRGSGRAETVQFEGVIQLDGTIGEIRTIGTPLPDFEQTALDAVRQWAFDSTLLNCEPVLVRMKIHVHFAPGR